MIKNNSLALNNIGNISYLQERLDDAKLAYEAALQAAPADVGTMANLSRLLLKMNKKEESRTVFRAAADIDPRVLRNFRDLVEASGMSKDNAS